MKPVKCKRCGEIIGDADDLAFETNGETTRLLKCGKCGTTRKFYLESKPRKR